MDVALGRLDADTVNALGVLERAEREQRHYLRLAPGEQTGAVHARGD